MRRLFIYFSALFLICMGILSIIGYRTYFSDGKLQTDKNIVIPKGNISSIIANLQQNDVIYDSLWNQIIFRISVWMTHKSGALHAAEFKFPKHASMRQVLFILRHAKPVQHELVIPEGLTAYQIMQVINHAPYLTGEISSFAEASVLPQTYAYEWGESRERLLHQMQAAMQKETVRIWSKRDKVPEVQTVQDMVIIASLVEKETALAFERPMIARVFVNRLHLGMRLQSDPTVIYALTDGKGNLGRRLTRKDWEVANPYNTYWTDDLPPTPICSPGVAAMEAVAHPADGKMLYFVANGSGGHSFSASLSEHNHNVMIRQKKTHH